MWTHCVSLKLLRNALILFCRWNYNGSYPYGYQPLGPASKTAEPFWMASCQIFAAFGLCEFLTCVCTFWCRVSLEVGKGQVVRSKALSTTISCFAIISSSATLGF